jgi:hypothetical protein
MLNFFKSTGTGQEAGRGTRTKTLERAKDSNCAKQFGPGQAETVQ